MVLFDDMTAGGGRGGAADDAAGATAMIGLAAFCAADASADVLAVFGAAALTRLLNGDCPVLIVGESSALALIGLESFAADKRKREQRTNERSASQHASDTTGVRTCRYTSSACACELCVSY